MAREGWTVKEIAAVLDVSPSKVSQALNPAMEKVARLFRADPAKTMRDLLEAMDKLEPMTDTELTNRERVLNGRPAIRSAHPS